MADPPEALRARFHSFGQEQVFRFWDRLTPAQQERFARELAEVPPECLQPVSDAPPVAQAPPDPPQALGPPFDEEARLLGEEALARGLVAAVLLAGGQGTRLGHAGPKGTYPIGPISKKSLYQWFAEQMRGRSRRAGRAIPWVVMTSPATHDESAAWFAAHDRFGLAPEQVAFCRQATRPVRGPDGELLLAAPDRLVRAPDGHGGLVQALADAGRLDALAAQGVEHCFVFQVDNPLAKVLDPATIGYHIIAKSQATSRAIVKLRPEEPHGVFCRRGGKLCVLEYTEITDAQARQTDPDGQLTYRAANIAVHVFRLDFLQEAAARPTELLPWHVAHKPVQAVGEDGTPESTTVTGRKEERFIFDLLPHARKPLLLEDDRAEWFAPAKTAEGEFSGPAARAAISAQAKRWCLESGLPVAGEISPLLALDAEELRGRRGEAVPVPLNRSPANLEPKV
jgi:UDP-N-acetylglucosamine/UDP-N-acetylgalactosamine diphosphorylase